MRARYYDPEAGRFVSEDPLGFEGGDVNFYVYGANNPVRYIDFQGESPVVPVIVGTVAIVVTGYILCQTGKEVYERIMELNEVRQQSLEKIYDPDLAEKERHLQGEIELIAGIGMEATEAVQRITNPIGTIIQDTDRFNTPDVRVEMIERGVEKLK